MSIPASIIYYYCKIWRIRDSFLSLCLRSSCSLPRSFSLFLSPGAVACSGCMTFTAICVFSRHVWACLALFSSAILNYTIVVYLFIRLYTDKVLRGLFSADFKASVFYTAVLETYCLRIKLSVVFYSVLRFSKLNSIYMKCLYFLQRSYCNNYCWLFLTTYLKSLNILKLY
jgi:hypothetical protein